MVLYRLLNETREYFRMHLEFDSMLCDFAVFQGLCSALNSLDQGLVCSSNSNVETARETSFQCYYILLPSDKGLMLLRVRIFASFWVNFAYIESLKLS